MGNLIQNFKKIFIQGVDTSSGTVPVSGTVGVTGVATETTLAAIKNTDGVKKITDALPAGTNLLGKTGIDQTTPGTTNAVAVKDSTGTAISSSNPLLTQQTGVTAIPMPVSSDDLDAYGSMPTTPRDASGHAIGADLSNDGDYHLKVSAVQNVIPDSTNSSTTNLAVGNSYTFTGATASTLNIAGIQVKLYADQNCKIHVQQSDTTVSPNWDVVDTYYYTSGASFGVTVQAVSSYYRVVVTTNNLTTTAFRLATTLCPIVEVVPRSLDANGNFKIANPKDNYGFASENTPMGELRNAEPIRLVGSTFEGTTLDGNFWTTAATGGGGASAIAQANAQVLITTGTGSGDTVTAFTVRRARYVGGSAMRYRAVVQIDAGTANNTRRWGIGWGSTAMPAVTDGAYFQISGTTFGVATRKGNSESLVTSFNGNLGATYSPGTSIKTYEIYWTNSKVIFVVGDEILHTVSATSATWANTMNFHAFMDSVNSAGASSVTMAIRVATIYRLGKFETATISKNVTGVSTSQVLKYGPGVLHRIIIGTPVNNKTVTIYDNTTGTTSPIILLTLPNSATPFTMECGIPFFNGLNVVPNDTGLNLAVVYE